MEPGDRLEVEKIVALYTSRDPAISEPAEDASALIGGLDVGFDRLLERHVQTWRHLWDRMQLDIGHDGEVTRVLYLHLFHLLQVVSSNSATLDVGVPARGLHGEAYRGHIFWDEIFILPTLGLRLPELARALLLYRWRRMDQARRAAVAAGYRGAMFPWQSASNGQEQTQTLHLNPRSGRWSTDSSSLQRHVNASIAYNVWQYVETTGDHHFLRFHGAEMILEIARFWASTATYDPALGRYEIKGVMGPDEFHERYPDRTEPGLDNNAYTNLMAVWCLRRAFDVLDLLAPAARQRLLGAAGHHRRRARPMGGHHATRCASASMTA